ncbi:MAG: thiamine phosphate synthase [Oscillospiraceae bacterium]|jgi:thiamine-phosphate diphosphorylase|nr:thiamine phosphate synthase [Oscillospiraceae bacterium]MDD3261102.1 thiamine phosphate synthase [Oscillospiraceae bacterium]
MKCSKQTMLLYAVTDRAWVGKETLLQQIEDALKGGATCIQLREKELDDTHFLQEALQAKALCRRYGVPFIIDDDVEIAVKSGADGVHVGQHDMQAGRVRRLIGSGMILGVSAQTKEQALAAQENGADYLGVGAVFPTETKKDADAVSYSTLKEICAAVSIPVCAIGGISQKNLLQLTGSGIDGVALVSAVFGSPNIEKSCRELLALSRQAAAKE